MTTSSTTTTGTWSRWKGLLALSAATSVGLNVWHAGITAAIGAAVLASIAPVFLFWITHNLITDPAGVKNWREDKVGVGVAALVTLGAFAVSYVTQKDLALLLGMEPFVARILPVIVDLTIGVSSYKLMREAEITAVRQAEQAEPVHQPDQAPAPEYPDTLTWLTPVHTTPEQPVHQEPETEPVPASDTSAPPVTSEDKPVRQPAEVVHQEPVTEPVHVVERPHLAAVHADAPEQAPVVHPVHLKQAAAVVQAGASLLPTARIAEVFARKDRGESQNEIAKAVPVNKRTVSKILAAREEITPEEAEPEPALA